MKQFFKFMFASMLGVMLTFLLLFLITIGIFSTIGAKEPKAIAENSVLHLELTNQIVERASESPLEGFDFMTFSADKPIGLNELLKNIRKAKEDENIKGIFLDLSFVQAGMASIYEIRNQLIDFSESGKFIVAYGNYMTQGAYYLASVADEIYINPEGAVDFRGLNANVMFFKNMLEKVGIEIDVIRHGKYKSAGEPFFREKLSDENRAQTEAYVSSLWNTVLMDISSSRGKGINQLMAIADSFKTRTPEGAVESGMIDGIAYRDEILDNLRERLELDADDKINFVNYSRYHNAPLPISLIPTGKREKIAVIYGNGGIVMGEGDETSMGADRIAEALKTARLDTTIKAIVFRINSPGGSALASEIMLREAMLAADAKPLVVSMGDVAASGGYYVAAHATKIIANPNTITGSIGVFGMVPNMKEMFNDKLGITFDNVKTNELADLGSINRPLTRIERDIIQEGVDRVYTTFINHVAEGRGLPVATVDSIAQGRVWSGVDAKQIGLVDDFGGINVAIEQAAELAGIEAYRLVELPVIKDFFVQIMESLGEAETRILRARLGESYHIYEQINNATQNTGIQMRMPFDITIE
jgi:protease IV